MTTDTDHPLPVILPVPVGAPLLRLDGPWTNAQPVPDAFPAAALPGDHRPIVPGEVVMQGLPLDPAADVALFKAAHVNDIRTSHYPPVLELRDGCDRAGILVEVEAPICFALGSFGMTPRWETFNAATQKAASDHIRAVSLEMVAAHGLHPSVALWSVAHESQWCPPFERSSAAIKAADPTRPPGDEG